MLHEIPHLEDYLKSLYNGEYAKFFVSLAALETTTMKQSWVLFPHYRYYVREMRIRAYAQLLESYRSLTMQSMAQSFGVSEEFIDRYMSNTALRHCDEWLDVALSYLPHTSCTLFVMIGICPSSFQLVVSTV